MDDLNQILLYMQEQPESRAMLRGILLEVARHETYRTWMETAEYHGLLFRLHRSLAFTSDEERRLLELLKLVEADALRVKLHARGENVFLTDGLWVSSAIRVFPFIDESDLVLRACSERGLTDWATCAIDPAVGCGPHVLRYQAPGSRRYGFDRSARAVAYAAINSLINDCEDALFGINDIRRGIPAVVDQDEERVLVLANMPFSLSPSPNTLVRTAEGGRYGYELTIALFDSVKSLADRLPASSEVRCVAVAYSVGSAGDDQWAVRDMAAERFGSDQVEWTLLRDEPLWRVNGKKEEENPMPLSALRRKVDCRFYVRREANRDKVRAEYDALARELNGHGYSHLGYGTLSIAVPRETRAATPVAA
jgi:hypothetical protein